jgi:hypothetical protein
MYVKIANVIQIVKSIKTLLPIITLIHLSSYLNVIPCLKVMTKLLNTIVLTKLIHKDFVWLITMSLKITKFIPKKSN